MCCDVHSRDLQLLLFRTLANLLVRQQFDHWVVFLGQDECILEHARLRSSEGSKVALYLKASKGNFKTNFGWGSARKDWYSSVVETTQSLKCAQKRVNVALLSFI